MRASIAIHSFRLAFSLALAIAWGSAGGIAEAEEKPRVAVLTLEAYESKEESEAIAEELRQQFVNSEHYIVIDRTLTSKIAEEWATQQSGLTDEEKAVNVGKLYNVQLVLTGKLNKFSGGGWQISAVIINAQSGVAERAATVRHRGDFFTLLDSKVPKLAQRLLLGSHAATVTRPVGSPALPRGLPPVSLLGIWSDRKPMATARRYHASAVFNQRLFVFGGEGESGTLNLAEAYDPEGDRWQSIPSLPVSRSHGTAATVGDRIYLAGGANGGKLLRRVDVFHPLSGEWTTVPELPRPRRGAVSVAVFGKIYLFGGLDEKEDSLALVDEFDPASGQWSAKATMPHARAFATAREVNGVVYVIGGSHGELGGLSYVEGFDPRENRWAPLANLSHGRNLLASAVLGEKIYIFGGRVGNFLFSSPYGRFEAYSPAENIWDEGMDLETGLFAHTAETLGGKVYLVGGLPENRSNGLHEIR